MSRPSYRKLGDVLQEAATARACIAQNSGPDKEQAREAYEYLVGYEVVPAMLKALDDAVGDIEDARTVERLAAHIAKVIEKET